jgi:hypothetical protein
MYPSLGIPTGQDPTDELAVLTDELTHVVGNVHRVKRNIIHLRFCRVISTEECSLTRR